METSSQAIPLPLRLEGPPMIAGPALQAGHVGLAAEQAEEDERRKRGIGVADPAGLAGVVDPGEGVEQGGDGSRHP